MKTHTKSILVIVASLLIGMLIGALGHGAFRGHQFRRMVRLRTQGGFVSRIEAVIQPEPAQQEAVRGILSTHARQVDEARSQFFAELHAETDSMKARLAPILTDEQKARLDEEFKRLRRRPPPPPPEAGRDKGRRRKKR